MYIHVCPALYVNKRGTKKTIQLYTKPYILLVMTLIFSVLRNVGFAAKTIHKLYTNYTLNPSQNYTLNSSQNVAQILMLKLEKPFPLGRGLG